MIQPVTMYGVVCDNCGERWIDENNGYAGFTDEISMGNVINDDDTWHSVYRENKHYCPKCFHIDDDDNLVIHPKL